MKPSRGVLKYGLPLVIGAWMFALGVIVGRGTSPVTFDTESFQERLRVIVGQIPRADQEPERPALDHEALNKPVPRDSVMAPVPEQKAVARREQEVPAPGNETIPVKQSLKLATINRGQTKAAAAADKHPGAGKTGSGDAKAVETRRPSGSTTKKASTRTEAPGGEYTIQVAAYRAFKDAVSQMSTLQKKGISAYRTKATSNGVTWYRVRTGSFKDFQSARAELNRLKQAKINGMIIKKDDQ